MSGNIPTTDNEEKFGRLTSFNKKTSLIHIKETG